MTSKAKEKPPADLPTPQRKVREILIQLDYGPSLDDVVKFFKNVRLKESAIKGQGYCLNLPTGGHVIMYKQDDPPAEQKMTIAHELGHVILNRITRGITKIGEIEFGAEQWVEDWCEAFAECLMGELQCTTCGLEENKFCSNAFHVLPGKIISE